jgi:hypothetical protein
MVAAVVSAGGGWSLVSSGLAGRRRDLIADAPPHVCNLNHAIHHAHLHLHLWSNPTINHQQLKRHPVYGPSSALGSHLALGTWWRWWRVGSHLHGLAGGTAGGSIARHGTWHLLHSCATATQGPSAPPAAAAPCQEQGLGRAWAQAWQACQVHPAARNVGGNGRIGPPAGESSRHAPALPACGAWRKAMPPVPEHL